MARNSTPELARLVFDATSPAQVDQILNHPTNSGYQWVPLGGRPNNSGNVNLAVESGQALVERVTNGFDAHIELRYERAGRPSGLNDPRSAVSNLWSLPASRLTREAPQMRSFIDEMGQATKLQVVGSFERGQSSVIVRDTGIGQHPDVFPTTLLSLGESNKIGDLHLMGAFGQGGSSTFAYCPYSIIVSRRHADCLGGRDDEIGWTIVRKYDDDSLKVFRYEYLVDADGRVPRFDAESLHRDGLDFEPGTRIVHVAYDLGRLAPRWSLVGYRYFDNLLFDPVLPYRIEDQRDRRRPFNRNLYGGRNRLLSADAERGPETQNYSTDLSQWDGEGSVRITCWVFKPSSSEEIDDEGGLKIGSYLDYDRSPRTILFTLNGQRHHVQEKSLVREARLGALADYLLIHVDCDGLSRSLKKEIFPATRSGATTGDRREDLLLQAIKEALADPWLSQKLDEIVRRRQSQINEESARRVRSMLDRLIAVHRTEQHAGGRRGQPQSGAARNGQARDTHDPPTFIKFQDHSRFDSLGGQISTMYLMTDGPDSMLDRGRRPGVVSLAWEGENLGETVPGALVAGRIPVRLQVPNSVAPGTRSRLTATLTMSPDVLLTDGREVRVLPPPPPYVGIDPPTTFSFAQQGSVTVPQGGSSEAQISTDARNDLLDRPVEPATIRALSDVPGVSVAIRGPRDGVVQVRLRASAEAVLGASGRVSVSLAIPGAEVFSAGRGVTVVAARQRTDSSGQQRSPVPAYEITQVWQAMPASGEQVTTWNAFDPPYDATTIGHWEMNGETLFLYLNMDERQFRSERRRWAMRSGESHAERLGDRYVAYVCFHMYQLQEQGTGASAEAPAGGGETDVPIPGSRIDPRSDDVLHELRRVGATLMQAMRSEVQLAELETEHVT